MRNGSTAAIWLLFAFPMASCSTITVGAYAGYTEMQFSGDLALTSDATSVSASTITQDLSDFGLGEGQGSPYGRVELDFGVPRISASAFSFEETGRGTLSDEFGDIAAGTVVDSTIDFVNIKGALTFDIDLSPIRISPGLGVDYFDLSLRVADVNSTLGEDIEVQAPIPMLFVQGELDLELVLATVDVGFVTVSTDEAEGTVWDIEAMARLAPAAGLELFAGYRLINFDAEADDGDEAFEADLTLDGWIIGGGVRF